MFFLFLAFDCAGKTGNYPDPDSRCSSIYYSCSNGQTFKRSCPTDGLRYDETRDLCDYPQFVIQCGGSPSTTVKNAPTQPQESNNLIKLQNLGHELICL